jgi:hypothetical protein
MLRLIGKVVLRNAYRVLVDSGGDYRVTHKDQRGAEYSQDVTAKVVNYVLKRRRGKTVSVADAQALLEEAPPSLQLPYSYGHRLQFYSQSVLIVLVARKQARSKKNGPRFDYTLHASSKGLDKTPRTRRKPDGTRSHAF